MFRATKISAFLAGVPLGYLMEFLNEIEVSNDEATVISQGQASLVFVIYSLICFVFFVFGIDSIKKRMKYSISSFYRAPSLFVKYHIGVFANDLLQVFICFVGVIIGGVVFGTQT